MQAVKFSLEAPTSHCLMNPLRTNGSSHKQHSNQIGIGFVRVHIRSGAEAPDSDGGYELSVFRFDNEDVAVGQQQQVNELLGEMQTVQGMAQGGDRHGRDQ